MTWIQRVKSDYFGERVSKPIQRNNSCKKLEFHSILSFNWLSVDQRAHPNLAIQPWQLGLVGCRLSDSEAINEFTPWHLPTGIGRFVFLLAGHGTVAQVSKLALDLKGTPSSEKRWPIITTNLRNFLICKKDMQIRHSKGYLQSKTTQLSFSIFFQFSMLGELLGEECPAQVMAQWKLTLQNRGDSVTSVTSMTERKRKFEESMVLSHHGFAQLPNWLKKISTNFFFFARFFSKSVGFGGNFVGFSMFELVSNNLIGCTDLFLTASD